MKTEIAVIGYGRFGRFLAHHLRRRCRVYIADKNIRRPVEKGLIQVSLQEAASKKIVILAVPVRQLRVVLKQISPILLPGTLVCDVCSVKEQPSQWMLKDLPAHVSLLGTHPLFGPDSAAESIQGNNIILCPLRISHRMLRTIKTKLQGHGLRPRKMSPQSHDKLMASTLFLTQFIGRGLRTFQLPSSTISTSNFSLLSHLVVTAHHDSAELFHDMYRYNRYAHIIPKKIISDFKKLSSALSK